MVREDLARLRAPFLPSPRFGLVKGYGWRRGPQSGLTVRDLQRVGNRSKLLEINACMLGRIGSDFIKD